MSVRVRVLSVHRRDTLRHMQEGIDVNRHAMMICVRAGMYVVPTPKEIVIEAGMVSVYLIVVVFCLLWENDFVTAIEKGSALGRATKRFDKKNPKFGP